MSLMTRILRGMLHVLGEPLADDSAPRTARGEPSVTLRRVCTRASQLCGVCESDRFTLVCEFRSALVGELRACVRCKRCGTCMNVGACALQTEEGSDG